MKRARDDRQHQQHQQQEEQETPPPPPPRKRKGFAAGQQDIPPPPPPRNKKGLAGANGSSGHPSAASASVAVAAATARSKTNGDLPYGGGGGGGGGANVFSGSSSVPAGVTGPSSNPTCAAPKRAKIGLGQPDGWRATADEVLLKAGIGEGGRGAGSSARGDAKGVPALGEGARDAKDQRGRTTAAARSKRRFAVVCAANFNRSMMAHELLRKHNFRVESYGTSRDLRLPGKSIASPEVFPFGTPYRDLHDTLKRKDEAFFLKNNLLRLAARNATIKAAPQRFQDIEGPDLADFDVVLCFEARVFYSVVEDLQSRDPETFKPLHVINMTIKDSFEESAAASGNVLELCRTLDGISQLEDEAAGVLEAFTRKSKRSVLHQVCHV